MLWLQIAALLFVLRWLCSLICILILMTELWAIQCNRLLRKDLWSDLRSSNSRVWIIYHFIVLYCSSYHRIKSSSSYHWQLLTLQLNQLANRGYILYFSGTRQYPKILMKISWCILLEVLICLQWSIGVQTQQITTLQQEMGLFCC
jgi:hypothetical protein